MPSLYAMQEEESYYLNKEREEWKARAEKAEAMLKALTEPVGIRTIVDALESRAEVLEAKLEKVTAIVENQVEGPTRWELLNILND